MKEKISANFTLSEFTRSQTATRKGIDNSIPADAFESITKLVKYLLQPLRDCLDTGVHISSGYRCVQLNTAIGGAKNSQHCFGEAADIIVYGKTPAQIAKIVVNNKLPFDQMIDEGSWLHISYAKKQRGKMLTAHFYKGKASYTSGIKFTAKKRE